MGHPPSRVIISSIDILYVELKRQKPTNADECYHEGARSSSERRRSGHPSISPESKVWLQVCGIAATHCMYERNTPHRSPACDSSNIWAFRMSSDSKMLYLVDLLIRIACSYLMSCVAVVWLWNQRTSSFTSQFGVRADVVHNLESLPDKLSMNALKRNFIR